MKTQDWPNNGVYCLHCERDITPGSTCLGGFDNIKGSVVFHKDCILEVVIGEWPEDEWNRVRNEIIANAQEIFT